MSDQAPVKSPMDGGMEMRLMAQDFAILRVLDETGGLVTRDVVKRSGLRSHNNRQLSGAVRSWLVQIQRRGLVSTLDDRKPVAWVRTHAGTDALENDGIIGKA